jgi:hypothetical protein
MNTKQLRKEVVSIVREVGTEHNLDFRKLWNELFRQYAKRYHINPHELYSNDYHNRGKLDMLEIYEGLYGTITKLYILTKELIK